MKIDKLKQYFKSEELLGRGIYWVENRVIRVRNRVINRDKVKVLDELKSEVLECKKCELHKTRNKVVFGEGNPNCVIMLVGEAPGREEDLQGRPFVGEAGKLLDKMLEAIGFSREDVYIANVLKCRPPGNRDPLPGEIIACKDYLIRQIEIIKPSIILTLGKFATSVILEKSRYEFSRLRGKICDWKGIKVLPTFHPAALLRHGGWKKEAWEHLKLLKRLYDEREERTN